MKLISEQHGLRIDIKENSVINLVIENRKVFSEIIKSLLEQTEGNDGILKLSIDEKEVLFSKHVVFLSNPLQVNHNDRKILVSLHKELLSIAQDRLEKEFIMINRTIVELLDTLNGLSAYNLTMDYELDHIGLFKLFNIKICSDNDNYVDSFLDYLRVISRICKTSVVIILNLKQYFGSYELEEIYKTCFYEKITLINIEGHQSEPISGDRYYILDKDFCIIDA